MNKKPGLFILAAVILIGIMGDGMAVSPTQEELNAATLWTMANLTDQGGGTAFELHEEPLKPKRPQVAQMRADKEYEGNHLRKSSPFVDKTGGSP